MANPFWSENIGYFVLASMIILCVIAGVIFYRFFKIDLKDEAKKRYSKIKARQMEKTMSALDKRIAYDALNDFLVSRGVKYRMGDEFTPFDYQVLRIFVSLLLGLVLMIVNPFFVIIGFILGWFGVPYYFKHEDEYDSKEMLSDISQMYGIVSLQIRNGVFLSKIIYECYIATTHPRLKKALNELAIEIERFSDIKMAVKNFRAKFNNKYIDIFARALEQAQDTGKARELFEDIEKQIATINEAMAIRREQSIKSLCGALEIVVFVGAMMIVCYIVFSVGRESLSTFF